ncbi:MAG: peptidoglycan DD-metalloendopeptidase family protein [Clostridiales Family XIII bacterium]|nr:peptidoglycan DD-metalloendopeptidase family protein [Clostridiales Family XIII bacterium]
MRKKETRRHIAVILASIFVLSLLTAGSVYADLQTDLDEAKARQQQAQDEYDAKKSVEDDLAAQVTVTLDNIAATQTEIENITAEIAAKEIELTAASLEVSKKEKEYNEQNRELGERLRMMYESGDQSVIEVLLGSESVVDFLENLDMVKRIHQSDVDVLNSLDESLTELEAKRDEVEAIKESLAAYNENLVVQEQNLEAEKATLEVLYEEAKIEASEAQDNLEEMKAETARIQSQIYADIASGSYYTGGFGGYFGWPCNATIVTCPYGGYPGHKGLDIGASYEPVYACADGVVTVASYGWGGGWGNYIMIDHGVDSSGNHYRTLYAHNSTLLVSVGQTVSRGQQISVSGNTGNSTGPHLHLEVWVNGVQVDPWPWVT